MWRAADAYERFMGRWSRRVAMPFLDALDSPAEGTWLDVGCGVGTVTAAIVDRCAPTAVVGVDPSAAFLRLAADGKPATSAVGFCQAGAQRLPFPEATFDATVSGLTLNFVADPARALQEMARVTRLGNTVAAYVWDYDYPDFFLTRFWDAAERATGTRAPGDERGRWRVCSPAGLAEAARRAGLSNVRTWTIRIDTTFRGPAELWEGFLLGVGPSGAWAAELHPDERAHAGALFTASLPVAEDGLVRLTAAALAVAGASR